MLNESRIEFFKPIVSLVCFATKPIHCNAGVWLVERVGVIGTSLNRPPKFVWGGLLIPIRIQHYIPSELLAFRILFASKTISLCFSTLSLHEDKICQTHCLFLQRECAQRLYVHILAVCLCYDQLAPQALSFMMIAFLVKPKYHVATHVLCQIMLQ